MNQPDGFIDAHGGFRSLKSSDQLFVGSTIETN